MQLESPLEQYKGLELVAHANATEFMEETKGLIAEKPDVHHQLIQIARLVDVESEFFAPPYDFWTARDRANGQVVGCALHVKPDGLVLSEIDETIFEVLWDGICDCGYQPKRIVCSPKLARLVIRRYQEEFGETLTHQKTWTVGRLDHVPEFQGYRDGTIRLATKKDARLVRDWAGRYGQERPAFVDVTEFMEMKLRAGELYLFDDGAAKAMATVSGRTKYGVRISSVFTPSESRKQGYAKAVVAKLSSSLIKEGSQFVVLTWKSGDSVGDVYKQIGFYPVCRRQSLCATRSILESR